MTVARMSAGATLALCALAAVFEGFDTQSMGVAAPRVAQELALSPAQLGAVFSIGTFGLFVGAAAGGRIADLAGRARTLAFCLLAFGTFSLLTAVATTPASLMIIRALTGLGLGGAMPTSIALASEASHPDRRVATTATLMAAMPLGGAIAGLIALSTGWGWSWREIFYVGGTGPILVGLTVLLVLPRQSATGIIEPRGLNGARTDSVVTTLFDVSRRRATLLLWVGFFFTQLLLLLMLNWLPSLMLGLGFSRSQASLGSVVFNLSGAIGANFLSRLHASRWQRAAVLLIYLGVIAALYTLRGAQQFTLAAVACGAAGVFIVGAQMILFALAPLFYPPHDRATGTGAAVAIGRLGSVVGPGIAGVVLATGGTSGSVLAVMLPFVGIAGSAVLALAWCRRWTE